MKINLLFIRFKIMKILREMYSMLLKVIKRLLAIFELFLFIRLILKFLNASPKALIVDLIYKGSDIIVLPFNFILPDIYWPKGRLIEIATISAMVFYAIAVLILIQLLRLFSKD